VSDYFDTGFCVREPSWHGKETLLAEAPKTWDEARGHAGLDWEAVVQPMYVRRALGMNPDGTVAYEYEEVPNFQTIQRVGGSDDTKNGMVLAAGQDSYEVISNTEMGEILHALTDKSELTYETGGSVREGRSVWALVRLGEDETIGNDSSPTRPYLGIVNHFDKTGACRAYATSIRIVCWNTMSAADAQADQDGTVAVFRHTSNWRDKLEQAREAVFGARNAWEEWKELACHLQGINVTDEMAEDFVKEFHPFPGRTENRELVTARVARNIDAARDGLRLAYQSRTCDGVRGTAYGLVQAAAEYLDHIRPHKSQQSYVRRTVIDSEKGKALGVRLALEVAGAR
jgi:phage/plasmid-like protein (TIGR03299 family)